MPPFLIAPVRRDLTIAAAFLAAFFMADAAPAQAQVQAHCGPRDSILTQLYLSHQEQPVAIGLTATGNVIELLTNGDGETWTIITTGPGGLTCVVQTGEHWQRVERQTPQRGS